MIKEFIRVDDGEITISREEFNKIAIAEDSK